MYVSLSNINEDTSEDDFTRIVELWMKQSISEDNEREQVVEFLKAVESTQTTDLLKVFVEIMKENNVTEDDLPYLSNLLTHRINHSILDIIVQVFDPEYYETVRGLMGVYSPDYLDIGIMNVKYIFQDSSPETGTVLQLYDKAKELSMPLLEIYLSNVLEEINTNYAEIPVWIIPTECSYITHKQLLESLQMPVIEKWVSVSVEEDAEYMCSIAEENYDLDTLYVDLIDAFEVKSKDQREELITWVNTNNTLMNMSLDLEMFRVLGGCLAMGEAYNLKLVSKDPCSMYGGCRAYTCYENQNVNFDTNEPIIDNPVAEGLLKKLEWFKGRCENPGCQLHIRKKHYAVRMPMESGGWLGCYCSFECIKLCLPEDNETRFRLTEGFEKIYNQAGIYERH